MIAGSYIAKLVALGLAVAVHGAVLLALGPGGREAVAVEGAEGAGEVRLGQGFSDMAAGRLEAQAAVDAVQAEAPEKVEATAAEAVVPVEQAEVVRAEAVPDTPAR
ncbi:energy transducer TonB, partial [Aquicoccus porphyridii]